MTHASDNSIALGNLVVCGRVHSYLTKLEDKKQAIRVDEFERKAVKSQKRKFEESISLRLSQESFINVISFTRKFFSIQRL